MSDDRRFQLRKERKAGIAVAANMRRLRRAHGWTQEELGVKLGGWSKASVSAAECSVNDSPRARAFDIDEVVLIAETLGVGVMDLITPLPPCRVCSDEPPAGMICRECGASGPEFGAPEER